MKIYRVEHPDCGRGPFQRGHFAERHPKFGNYNDYPTPGFDGLGWLESRLVCGCQSLELLKHWFGDHVDELQQEGFVVKVFDAPAMGVGKKQVVFEPAQAECLEELPVTILEKAA